MSTELTEEEMRQALFGGPHSPPLANIVDRQETAPNAEAFQRAKSRVKKQSLTGYTPRLKVTLRVGNEFEGETHELMYEADTLSYLLAEQEATKSARKKFRFVEVVSVKSM